MPFRKSRGWGNTTPSLGSKVNFNHPLTVGLNAAWLMNPAVGNRIPDIVGTNDFTTSASSLATDYKWQPSVVGVSLFRDGTANTNFWSLTRSISTGPTFSFAIRLNVGTLALKGMLFGEFGVRSAGSVQNLGGNGFGTDLSATALTIGKWYDLVYSINAGTITYYINGVKDANTFAGHGSVTISSGLGSDTNSLSVNCNIAHLYYWAGRALGAQEAMELMVNPYGIITPQRFGLRQQQTTGITNKTIGFAGFGAGGIMNSGSKTAGWVSNG